MTLEQIDELGLQIFRSPEVRTPMCDALEDFGMSWLDWLDRGTLRRLAECMLWVLHPSEKPTVELLGWLDSVDPEEGQLGDRIPHPQVIHYDCRFFSVLATSFCVPPITVQIREPHRRQLKMQRWYAPTVGMAEAALRAAVVDPAKVLEPPALDQLVRLWHPKASAYLTRTGSDDPQWRLHEFGREAFLVHTTEPGPRGSRLGLGFSLAAQERDGREPTQHK